MAFEVEAGCFNPTVDERDGMWCSFIYFLVPPYNTFLQNKRSEIAENVEVSKIENFKKGHYTQRFLGRGNAYDFEKFQ